MTTQRRLDADGIREMLRGEPFVRQLIVEERVGSTNDRIRELAATGAEEGTVVIAESQSRGRGRLGRSWLSRPGLGLYLSVLFRPRAPIPELTRWTLAAAVAACAACRQVGGCKVEIDWPNDLVHDGRKLGGLLADPAGEAAASLAKDEAERRSCMARDQRRSLLRRGGAFSGIPGNRHRHHAAEADRR